ERGGTTQDHANHPGKHQLLQVEELRGLARHDDRYSAGPEGGTEGDDLSDEAHDVPGRTEPVSVELELTVEAALPHPVPLARQQRRRAGRVPGILPIARLVRAVHTTVRRERHLAPRRRSTPGHRDEVPERGQDRHVVRRKPRCPEVALVPVAAVAPYGQRVVTAERDVVARHDWLIEDHVA